MLNLCQILLVRFTKRRFPKVNAEHPFIPAGTLEVYHRCHNIFMFAPNGFYDPIGVGRRVGPWVATTSFDEVVGDFDDSSCLWEILQERILPRKNIGIGRAVISDREHY